jgi:hypothetical protein
MAKWNQWSLDKHYAKHAKDGQCWKQLLGKSTPVTKKEYSNTSILVQRDAWLEYEAQEAKDGRYDDFYPRSAYFVDDREIKVTLTLDRALILSSYHRHYWGSSTCPRKKPVGEQRARFYNDLMARTQGKMLILKLDIKKNKMGG